MESVKNKLIQSNNELVAQNSELVSEAKRHQLCLSDTVSRLQNLEAVVRSWEDAEAFPDQTSPPPSPIPSYSSLLPAEPIEPALVSSPSPAGPSLAAPVQGCAVSSNPTFVPTALPSSQTPVQHPFLALSSAMRPKMVRPMDSIKGVGPAAFHNVSFASSPSSFLPDPSPLNPSVPIRGLNQDSPASKMLDSSTTAAVREHLKRPLWDGTFKSWESFRVKWAYSIANWRDSLSDGMLVSSLCSSLPEKQSHLYHAMVVRSKLGYDALWQYVCAMSQSLEDPYHQRQTWQAFLLAGFGASPVDFETWLLEWMDLGHKVETTDQECIQQLPQALASNSGYHSCQKYLITQEAQRGYPFSLEECVTCIKKSVELNYRVSVIHSRLDHQPEKAVKIDQVQTKGKGKGKGRKDSGSKSSDGSGRDYKGKGPVKSEQGYKPGNLTERQEYVRRGADEEVRSRLQQGLCEWCASNLHLAANCPHQLDTHEKPSSSKPNTNPSTSSRSSSRPPASPSVKSTSRARKKPKPK